jgi:integrase
MKRNITRTHRLLEHLRKDEEELIRWRIVKSDGASPVYVKEQMGHASIQMTVDIYGHLIPSSNRAAVKRLDAHPNAPQAHPPEIEKAQSVEIAPLS